jgi:hypothetical protein
MNISRLQSLLDVEMDDAARKTVRQILNEFEEAAAQRSRCDPQPIHL